MARMRTIGNHSQLFGGLSHGVTAGAPPPGRAYPWQMAGTPTAPEYYEGPGKWNALIPPLLLTIDFLRQLWEKYGGQ